MLSKIACAFGRHSWRIGYSYKVCVICGYQPHHEGGEG